MIRAGNRAVHVRQRIAIREFSRIPDLRPEGRFRSTVACRIHHLGRDRNSFEFGTAECGQWILREQ